MKRTAQAIEEKKSLAESTAPTRKQKGIGRGNHPNSRKQLKPIPWVKGQSGNPSGMPGTDLAALYARRFFEAHPEGITEELAEGLKGLNAYAYGVLADRGYGKVKETQLVEHTGELAITIKLVKAKDGDD